MLRRGSSSKKEGAKEAKADVTDKKAAKLKAAEEKAAKKKEAKEKAAQAKAEKKKGKAKKVKEPRAEKAPKVPSDAPRGVLVRRPKTSIYSVMLGITAGALTIGCLVLILEIWTYGAPWTFPWNIPPNLR